MSFQLSVYAKPFLPLLFEFEALYCPIVIGREFLPNKPDPLNISVKASNPGDVECRLKWVIGDLYKAGVYYRGYENKDVCHPPPPSSVAG